MDRKAGKPGVCGGNAAAYAVRKERTGLYETSRSHSNVLHSSIYVKKRPHCGTPLLCRYLESHAALRAHEEMGAGGKGDRVASNA